MKISVIIKLGIIALLIIAISSEHSINFYMNVRWLVFFSSIYLVIKSKTQGIFSIIIFSLISIIFNPILPFHFRKELWNFIDIIAVILIGVGIDWKSYKEMLSERGKIIFNLIKNCFWGIIAIIVAFWLVLNLGGNPYNEYLLITKGITTKGYITSVDETSTDTDQGNVFSYNYAFYFKTTQEKKIKSLAQDDGRVPNELMNLTTPHPFDIVYLIDNPEINMPKDKICDSLGEFFWRKCGFGFFILLMLSSIGFILIRKAIKDYKIANKNLQH